jgi:hypothetical protein
MNFEYFIKNNFCILKTLFHINENNLIVIDDTTRIIKRNIYISHLFNSIPILKGFLEEILKDLLLIESKITEKFNCNNNEFLYNIKFYNSKISNLRVYLKLYQDNINTNIINISINIMRKNNNFNTDTITEDIIGNIIINYYKSNFIENDLKTLFKKINHHSFELNII